MKLIHVKCLQTWLKSKLHTKNTGHTTFIYWKSLECELCKTPYPQFFEVDNKRYDIVEIERPNSAYIVMELLSKDKNITRGVHVIKMEGKNNIRLGRGHDSDIRITDISVSRCHALIKLDKGEFYIEDNNSKFGTLLHLNKPVPIVGDFNNISVQVGRTIVSLSVKKGKHMLPVCSSPTNYMSTSPHKENKSERNALFADVNQNGRNVLNNNPIVPAAIRIPDDIVPPRERDNRPDGSDDQSAESLPMAVEPNEDQDNFPEDVVAGDLGENEADIGDGAEERSQ